MAQSIPQNDWKQSDAVALRTFLAANPRFLTRLFHKKPKIQGKEMAESALTGRECQGWMNAIEEIKLMQLDPHQSADNPDFVKNDSHDETPKD